MDNTITDVEGIRLGHFSDFNSYTGCTVVLCEKGAVGSYDIRGPAVGTREMFALKYDHLVDKVHGILLSGGSAFGLDAAGGVMDYLEKRKIGFDVSVTKVPLVPSAIIFDLNFGDFRKRPDRDMGYSACLDARKGKIKEGSVGAGTGATVGKIFGIRQAMKGGVGTFSIPLKNGVVIGAVVVVNAYGDVIDFNTRDILAGARTSEKSFKLVNSAELINKGIKRKGFILQNTTIGVIATNAGITKRESKWMARRAQSGIAKTISPSHTCYDGDIIFTLSVGNKKIDIELLSLNAERVIMEAIRRAIIKADGFGILPAYKDIKNIRRGDKNG